MGTQNKKSKLVHKSRPRVRASWLARSKKHSRISYFLAKNSILTIIALAGMIVVLSVFISLFNTPERAVERKIESIARDYYENYYYDQILALVSPEKPLSVILDRYAATGFNKMSLDQLLLFDNGRHSAARPTLLEYCNETATSVQIFPVSPYSRSDYRIEYNYSCNF